MSSCCSGRFYSRHNGVPPCERAHYTVQYFPAFKSRIVHTRVYDTHTRYISRKRCTRKRGYMPLTVSHYALPDRGANLFRPRLRSRKGCNYSTFRSVDALRRKRERQGERRGGGEGWESSTKRTEFTVRDAVERTGEEGVTSRRDAVGMFSQTRGDHL